MVSADVARGGTQCCATYYSEVLFCFLSHDLFGLAFLCLLGWFWRQRLSIPEKGLAFSCIHGIDQYHKDLLESKESKREQTPTLT